MSEYLDMLPVEVVQTLLRRLLQELVWDASSPSVRLAVVKVRNQLRAQKSEYLESKKCFKLTLGIFANKIQES